MSNLEVKRAAVYLDGRQVARILYSGRMIKVEARGKALGRLLPTGFLDGEPDDGRGRYDLWSAKHPHVPTPSDAIVAEDLTFEEAVARALEGVLSGARLPVLLLPELQLPGAAVALHRYRLHRGRRHGYQHRHDPGAARSQGQEAVAVSRDQDIFTRIRWGRAEGHWVTDVRVSGDWSTELACYLVGRKVNLGDKDGGVYEGVTVIALESSTGTLVLGGGLMGQAYGNAEPVPVPDQARLSVHDVARGVFCK